MRIVRFFKMGNCFLSFCKMTENSHFFLIPLFRVLLFCEKIFKFYDMIRYANDCATLTPVTKYTVDKNVK